MSKGKLCVVMILLASSLTRLWSLVPLSSLRAQTTGASGADLSKWATVEAHDNGVPVYAFGYTYVYGVSPDFRPGVVLQKGNDAAAKKIRPKKSWEIKNNLFGSTPARELRSVGSQR
jgi:hypothetical protein